MQRGEENSGDRVRYGRRPHASDEMELQTNSRGERERTSAARAFSKFRGYGRAAILMTGTPVDLPRARLTFFARVGYVCMGLCGVIDF